MANLHKILKLCERHGYLVPMKRGTVGDEVECFKLGSVGELLKHNIFNEWILSSVITPEENVFMCQSGPLNTGSYFSEELKEQYNYVKGLSGGQLPFGIAETRLQDCIIDGVPTIQQEAKFLESSHGTELKINMFTAHGDSAQRFQQWQRLRKMWWRKFSASPGRFSVTDARSSETGHTVHIQATFPWGIHTLETIMLHTSFPDNRSAISFEAKDGRKKVVPHVVECVTLLERALFTYLTDAYDETEYLGSQHYTMRLHRKLAPYKVAIAFVPSSEGEELGRLATSLGRLLRRSGVCVLLLPDVSSKSVESQFIHNDALGVPYTVVLNTATLKTGIIGLRNRDTTLKEQIHISELKTHIELIFKNY